MLLNRNANLEDFARVVEQDKDLTDRLLRLANPRATRKEDYRATTAEEAIQRTGMSIAFLLAMSDPLTSAIFKTFETMLDLSLKPIASADCIAFPEEHVLGEVTFSGKTTGLVHVRFPSSAVSLIGHRLLGLTPQDLTDPVLAADVIGEICNMVVGNFKSNLCDAGFACKLHPPTITRTSDLKLHTVNGGTSERYGFGSKEFDFLVDLSVNPR
jgi:CheY-specific phosphatase CheX